jgi:hypothetical protein
MLTGIGHIVYDKKEHEYYLIIGIDYEKKVNIANLFTGKMWTEEGVYVDDPDFFELGEITHPYTEDFIEINDGLTKPSITGLPEEG